MAGMVPEKLLSKCERNVESALHVVVLATLYEGSW